MRRGMLGMVALVAMACGRNAPTGAADAAVAPPTPGLTAPPIEKQALPPAIVTGAEVTVVTDPDALVYLEGHGFSFAERFAALPATPASGADLMKAPRYASLVGFVKGDVEATFGSYGPGKHPSIGNAHKTAREIDSKYAALNAAWLSSSASRFELVGVVNRFDRRILEKRAETCGEVRLIYRAAYRGPRESSRLPVTLIAVFPQGSSDCGDVARSWIVDGPRPHGEALARWLVKGPLHALSQGQAPVSIELNALVELWSRFVHETDGVGAHHRYTLRVFHPHGDALEPELLDNTPDVEAVVASPDKKRALQQWIAGNKAAIADGTAFLDELPGGVEVRATQVASLTAMGLTRASNRPYSRIFVDDLEAFRTAVGLATPGEARALLRKLDMTTCNGCHVTRSVLGFHLVGEERDAAAYLDPDAHENDPDLAVDLDRDGGVPHDQVGALRKKAPIAARVTANRMAVGVSAHLRDEFARRALDLRRYLATGAPVDHSTASSFEPMPSPDRGLPSKGTYAAPCALGPIELVGSDLGALACNPGLRCVPLDDSGYGQCIVAYEGAIDGRAVGDPFELQEYSVGTIGLLWATARPELDRGPLAGASAMAKCIGGGETGRDKGFPYGGICEPKNGKLLVDALDGHLDTGCRASDGVVPLGESGFLTGSGAVVTKATPGGREVVCSLAAFRASKTWGFMSTAAMAWNSISPGFQLACDLDHACRDEYVCMRRLPRADRSLRDPSQGTCQPGYLLNQLEIDAHQVPE
ncbi:MAG: hypothetical protein ABI175_04955 [Polyangiales bacterium]